MREKEKVRNEEACAAGRQNVLLNNTFTHSLTLSRTCEGIATHEVHFLHALGEHELANVTCEREGEERKKDQTRNEEACAADRRKLFK